MNYIFSFPLTSYFQVTEKKIEHKMPPQNSICSSRRSSGPLCWWKSCYSTCHPLYNCLTARTLTSFKTAGITTSLLQRSSSIWDGGRSVTGLGNEGRVTSQSFKTSLPPPAPAAAHCLSLLFSRKPKRPFIRWKTLWAALPFPRRRLSSWIFTPKASII